MGYFVEYATVGCLPDSREYYPTLNEAKTALRDMFLAYSWNEDNRVKVVTPLADITKKELQFGSIPYAEVRDISYISIEYVSERKYTLTEVTMSEEHESYAYCSNTQDSATLDEIQNLMHDYDITSAIFITENGDYDNLHVQYGYPSFRAHKTMFSVNWSS